MEAKEIRGLRPDELDSKLADMVQTYFNLRFQHKTGQLENPKRIGQVRRDIARIKTILREQALTNR
jgi:large subunit ribosomal protein L29